MPHRSTLDAVLFAIREYCSLTLPILLYVGIEAIHHGGWHFLLTSPEWGIATVFLGIHGPTLFEEQLIESQCEISRERMRFIKAAGLVLSAGALLNAFLSLDSETSELILVRRTMFAAASVVFFVMVSSARYVSLGGPGTR